MRWRGVRSWLLISVLVAQAACGGPLPYERFSSHPNASNDPSFNPGFNLFSHEQDIELGRASAREVTGHVALVEDEFVVSYVQRLGERLAAQAPGYDYPYRFSVVSTREINAYALPGGFIYVNAGAVMAARNEGELAGVLAHEISHVALRHGTKQASKAYIAKTGLGILGAVTCGGENRLSRFVGDVGARGANLLFLKLGRSSEAEADIEGARMMAAAGYDPRDMSRFYEKLSLWSVRRPHEVLSDHPHPDERIEAIDRFAETLSRNPAPSRDSVEFRRAKARLLAQALDSGDRAEKRDR